MPAQYIFTMRDLRRFYPPDREVLRGINLSFFPGAKIGVIGANGSGKSSLLRIMAGVDDGFTGEARLTAGFTVGFLPQEPQLDPDKDVAGNVTDGVAEIKSLLVRFDEVCTAMGDPDADFDKLLAEQAQLQDRIDAAGAWDLDRKLEIAMDALRLPAARRRASPRSRAANAGGSPCAGCCSRARTCCCSTSRPTTSTPSRWPGSSGRCRSTREPSSPSPTTGTSSTTWPGGSSSSTGASGSPGRATTRSWLEQKQARLAGEEKADRARQRTLERELEWIRMSPRARQSKGKARITAYNDLVAEAEAAARGGERAEKARDHHPAGPPARGRGGRGRRRSPRDSATVLLIEDMSFLLPPGGIVGRHRPERGRQDHPVPHDRRARRPPTRARCASATRCSSPTSTSPVTS